MKALLKQSCWVFDFYIELGACLRLDGNALLPVLGAEFEGEEPNGKLKILKKNSKQNLKYIYIYIQ